MSYVLPGSVFLACRAILQCPRNDPDFPSGRITDAHLYWYNTENDERGVDCILHYAERNPERPVTAGLYDIRTTVCLTTAKPRLYDELYCSWSMLLTIRTQMWFSKDMLIGYVCHSSRAAPAHAMYKQLQRVRLDSEETIYPEQLPAHIIVVGCVAAGEDEIGCFILNLQQAFFEQTTTRFLSLFAFTPRDEITPQLSPRLHDIVSIKGRVLYIDENRVTLVLEKITTLH
jgi:hypothetical protein